MCKTNKKIITWDNRKKYHIEVKQISLTLQEKNTIYPFFFYAKHIIVENFFTLILKTIHQITIQLFLNCFFIAIVIYLNFIGY
jgi:hypothetical protein